MGKVARKEFPKKKAARIGVFGSDGEGYPGRKGWLRGESRSGVRKPGGVAGAQEGVNKRPWGRALPGMSTMKNL